MSKYIRVWRASANNPRADIVWIVIDENNKSVYPHTDRFNSRSKQWAVMDELMTDNVQVHHNPPQYKFALEAYLVACEYEDVKPFPKHPGVTACDKGEDHE